MNPMSVELLLPGAYHINQKNIIYAFRDHLKDPGIIQAFLNDSGYELRP